MTTDAAVETKADFDLVAVFRAAAPESRDRKFWVTLVAALLFHALILLGLVRSAPRQIGDPNSTPDSVAVSFVTEAELKDATTGADGGGAKPAPQPTPPPQAQLPPTPEQPPQPQQPPAEAQPPPPPAPKPPEEQADAEAEKLKSEQLAKADQTEAPEAPLLRDSLPADATPEKKAEETKESKELKETKEAHPKEKPKTETEKPVESPHDLTKDRPDLLELPQTTLPPERSQQKQQAKPQQKQAMRTQPNLALPPNTSTTPSYEGRSAGVQRPAGITRSGANDDFARGVIKALRQTMPQINVLGQVTVKILINLSGNIESTVVLAPSDNKDLDRYVVFSTKQASFPLPPNGSTVDDRTFTITYIYH